MGCRKLLFFRRALSFPLPMQTKLSQATAEQVSSTLQGACNVLAASSQTTPGVGGALSRLILQAVLLREPLQEGILYSVTPSCTRELAFEPRVFLADASNSLLPLLLPLVRVTKVLYDGIQW